MDLLPAGVTFVSSNPSQGAYDNLTGVWTVGTVALAATPNLTIQATVVSPNARSTNTATVDGDQFDPNLSNNTDSTTADPQVADLALAKSVSDATPNVGDQITFTVTLTNHGPNTATGVQVADLLPAGVTFVSANPSQGTYTPATGLWGRRHGHARDAADAGDRGDGGQRRRPDQHRDHHGRRSVRPDHRQQHRQHHGDAAAGRPRHHQVGEQPDAQRRRPDHLHRHPDQQRSRRRHRRAGDRPAPRRPHLRLGRPQPGDLQFDDRPVDRRHGRDRHARRR